ncbi:bacteriophage T4 gp5 trimerization domain-containing protein, partial [Pseudomonas aeruginosa]
HKGDGFNEIRFEDEADQEEVFIHAQKDQNNIVNNDETTFVGHDRSERVENDESIAIGHDRTETVGNDEQVTIDQDRRHDIGRDDYLTVERNRTIAIGKDRTEEIGNHRRDKIAANHWVEIGGHFEQQVEGHIDQQAGQAIRQRSRVIELQAGEAIHIRGPGGSITLDDDGITLSAILTHIKGPVEFNSVGRGNPFVIDGNPNAGEESDFCLACFLRAARTGGAVVPA